MGKVPGKMPTLVCTASVVFCAKEAEQTFARLTTKRGCIKVAYDRS